MATVAPHPLCAAPSRACLCPPAFQCKLFEPSQCCFSSTFPCSFSGFFVSSPSSSCSSSLAATFCELRSESEEDNVARVGCYLCSESHRRTRPSFILAHPFWFRMVLQWTLSCETRRSFIAGSLQKLSSRLLPSSCSPSFVSTQLETIDKRDTFSRRIALGVPLWVAASNLYKSLALAEGAEETNYGGRTFLQTLGIGDPDIYYPRIFEGSWVCHSTLVAVDTPQGEDKADAKSVEFSRKQLGYTVSYRARFIPFEKHVIGDRLFTTLSLVESIVGSNIVDHGVWTPVRPDRLTLVLRGGRKVQNVVTKRSSSVSGPGQFDTSEYSEQIFDNAKLEGGPPTIKASQNRTRYRWDASNKDVDQIEAFQRVSMFPVVQEGVLDMNIMNLDKPVTVYKYIVKFNREAN